MKTVSLSGIKNNFDHFYELAHVERVHITEDGEDKVVMMPYIVYKQMRRHMPRQAYHPSELPEEVIKAIMETDYSDEEEADKDAGS